MLQDSAALSGFSTNDLAAAREFYSTNLGLRVEDNPMGMLQLMLTGRDTPIIIYPKADHQAASYTILNFPVVDIEAAVDGLVAKGIVFEYYDGTTDSKGIAWGLKVNRGPNISWFKDPAGNILSVLQDK
jgi:catechol 2,3-dioxygenase-like lactoylglutathione lyase family enzyme